jgi:hypothetical protein
MRAILVVILAVLLGHGEASFLSNLGAAGGMANMLTPFLPPEARGIAGAAASAAMAAANKKKGLIEFVTDGSEYGWICLCPTKAVQDSLVKQGFQAAADKCPEDQTMGCRPPQVDMSSAPPPKPAPKK